MTMCSVDVNKRLAPICQRVQTAQLSPASRNVPIEHQMKTITEANDKGAQSWTMQRKSNCLK
jgi:hypothetical protein